MRKSLRSLLAYAGIAVTLSLALAPRALALAPATTTFTYQGQLKNAGAPANGNYDFLFSLWDAASGGAQVGFTQTLNALPVSAGLFTTPLNFGAQFDGRRFWLQIAVRPVGAPFYTTLTTRQELTGTPYAQGLVLPYTGSTASASALNISTSATNGIGIFGTANNGTTSWGVVGSSTQGTGIVGIGGDSGGVFSCTGASGIGVSANGQTGVKGESFSNGTNAYGGYFNATGTGGCTGVVGMATNDLFNVGVSGTGGGTGVFGTGLNYGGRFVGSGGSFAYGAFAQGDTIGVVAKTTNTNTDNPALYANGGSVGVHGEGNVASSGGGIGTNFAVGVDGISFAGSTAGSIGGRFSSTVSGANGVLGIATGAGGYGVWGRGNNSALAGNFDGPVKINGALNIVGSYTATGSKSFKIDHPLNPAGAYLQHSCIESSEMLNLYTGNAQLDSAGRAVVQMPNWFTAENTDFRYQLTSIGAPGNGLYIARKMDGRGTFAIAGGTPGAEVSWQVTAVRNDVYARAANFQVEVAKTGDEVGRYLDPRVYGLDESLTIGGRKTPPNTPAMPAPLPQ